LAGVWNDVLQEPVERSQVFTTPSESLEMADPSFARSEMDLIGAGTSSVGSESAATGFVKALICQNLIELSLDAEIMEEENVMR